MEDPRKELSTLLDDTSATHEEHEAAKKNNPICRMPRWSNFHQGIIALFGFRLVVYVIYVLLF